MVAKITFPKKTEAALNYNEAKLRQGKAVCLAANGFLKEAGNMNFYEKLEGFKHLTVLNDRAATKTLHVSLNFDPSETLSDDKLIRIADTYMEKLGFGAQPFLVYKHIDAGHPHIHIVSTTIRDDGSRINTHNIGRNSSEKARKEIEQAFGLVQASKQQKSCTQVKAIDSEKASYGNHETKRTISTIVTAIFQQYKFSSLPEFNTALRQFNVVGDDGKEGGRIHRNRGLVYRILDKQGKKVGVPIKASSLSCQPTLTNLTKKFVLNEGGKELAKAELKATVESCLSEAGTMAQLVARLEQKNVYALLRQSDSGVLYGITFVDNGAKCVFNGSDLGKGYSAAGLQSRLAAQKPQHQEKKEAIEESKSGKGLNLDKGKFQQQQKTALPILPSSGVLDALLSVKEQQDNVPFNLLNKKRKKRKQNNNR